MAAFPPPTLVLDPDAPLLDLIQACPGFVTGYRRSHFPDREAILRWCQYGLTPYDTLLDQFEALLHDVHRHRGVVNGRDTFGRVWTTPFDCLNEMAAWRREISAALILVDRPPFFEPVWMTETVVALRNAILAEKAFDRLPILADALEEAGCDNRFILDHLRGDDDHAHMCWVLDLLSVGAN